MLKEGDKAPEFRLKDQNGEEAELAHFKGKKVVLYFYPKDDTSGCTKEACNFRDEMEIFEGVNGVVIGVSPDSVESHKKFSNKYNLQFRLLADPEKDAIEKYDVWKEKSMYGKKYMGVERTTFIINEDGIITKIFNKVKVDNHNAEVLDALKEWKVTE